MTPLRVDIASQTVSLFAQRAAFWHESSTLLVADVHLGRQQAWRAGGVPISDAAQLASLDEPLQRLAALIEATRATRLLVLGDLLHAPAGLTDTMIARVTAWRERHAHVQFEVIPGNHDRKLDRVAEVWNLTVREPRVCEPPFEFVHDPADAANTDHIACSGHIHPMVRLATARESVRVPAFLITPRLFLFPAFSGLFSGVTIDQTPDTRVYPIAGDKVLALRDSAATK
ncbi:MAG: ligase-associated DNA damage response endonuclease PdeM [Phycisphaerales bacterium]|nr:ligase-associated DNA damage response endonuclease PdeM [Phycisphaerales bacterium]